MFPWLPFLTVPQSRRRRRRRFEKRSSLSSAWLNTGAPGVRVEYLTVYSHSATVTAASSTFEVRDDLEREERPLSAPLDGAAQPVENPPPKKISLQSPRPDSRTSRSSPRPSSTTPSSRPSSTQPPPQPRVRPNRYRMFETSQAMRELFGAPSPPPPRRVNNVESTSRPDEKPRSLPPEEKTVSSDSSPVAGSESKPADSTPAAPVFQQLPPELATISGPSQFARTSALQKEATPGQWEEVPDRSTAPQSSFQTVPDHDLAHANAVRRNAARSEAGFNIITHEPNELFQPGPEIPQEPGCVVSSPRVQRNSARMEPVELGAPGPDMAMDSEESGSPEEEEEEEEGGMGEPAPLDSRTADWRESGQEEAEEGRTPQPGPQSPLATRAQPHHRPNGLPQLENDENRQPEVDQQERFARLLWARSEDGSGMVAASGSGSGGLGAGPLFIRGAQVVNDDALFQADIYIEDGVIKQILPDLEVPQNVEVIEANGKWILPAGIDVHTEFSAGIHANEFQNNSKAALVGGTTTVIDVVIPGLNERLTDAVERIKTSVDQKALCNVGLSISLQKWNEEVKKEVEVVVRDKKVNSFVLEMQNDSELFEALTYLKSVGALARVYPENKDIITLLEKQFSDLSASQLYFKARPVQLEAERIHRLCVLSQLTNAPISIMSSSSAEACRSITSGKQQGALVFAEVPITALSADLPQATPTQARIPIRKGEEHVKEAIEQLANSKLSVCVSGHRTPRESPNRPPFGVVAVGERLPALWERAVAPGRMDLMRFVAVTSSNPAKLFNLYPRKGRVAVGADADLVIWNGQTNKTLGCVAASPTDRSAFDGLMAHAAPETTICAGRVVYRNGKVLADKPSSSMFLPLPPDALHVFSVVKLRENTGIPPKPEPAPSRKESRNGQGSSGMFEDRAMNRNVDYNAKSRSTTKVTHPPGGKSSIF